MNSKKIMAYAFDCQGEMKKDIFDTEEQVYQWVKDHNLELFKIDSTYLPIESGENGEQ